MNLIKKLLPIATLGCTALVTPFVTSCDINENNDEKEYDYNIDFGNIRQYQRTTDIYNPDSGETKDDNAATELYATDINQNPQIVIDDICCAIRDSKIWEGEESFFAKCTPYGDIKVNINDVALFSVEGDNAILLSFDVKLNIKIDFNVIEPEYTDFSFMTNCDISFDKVPFEICYHGARGGIKKWEGELLYSPELMTLLEWKIIVDGYFKTVVLGREDQLDVDFSITKDLALIPGVWSYVELLLYLFHVRINYLSKLVGQ